MIRNCTCGNSTVFFLDRLPTVAVDDVDQIVCSMVIVTSQMSGLVLASHVPHDGIRVLVLHCLITEIVDGRDCGPTTSPGLRIGYPGFSWVLQLLHKIRVGLELRCCLLLLGVFLASHQLLDLRLAMRFFLSFLPAVGYVLFLPAVGYVHHPSFPTSAAPGRPCSFVLCLLEVLRILLHLSPMVHISTRVLLSCQRATTGVFRSSRLTQTP